MKKLIVSLLCISFLVSGMGAAAATRQYSRHLSPFKSIEVSGQFTVSLVRGSDYRALLSVEEAYIEMARRLHIEE